MSVADVVVVILGVALIAWELWYFLVPPRMETAVPRGGVQEISVLVKQGFEPDVIPVEAGRPVRLRFYRDETAASSGDVVFDTLGLRSPLPPFETTTVEFTPLQPGDYPFRCEAGPFTGRVVAEVGREAARVNLGQGHEKHV